MSDPLIGAAQATRERDAAARVIARAVVDSGEIPQFVLDRFKHLDGELEQAPGDDGRWIPLPFDRDAPLDADEDDT